ncbi:MAG: hypothetical protein U9Q21_02575 [Candidatus Auribacterota bacterium]|nr:hypothetical protein [Candidatus Auribacterota bacterium]
MAATGDNIQYSYWDIDSSLQLFEIKKPNFGYKCTIRLPWDIQESGNGHYGIYDNGKGVMGNDKYSVDCESILNSAQFSTFIEAYRKINEGRARNWGFNLQAGSGFYAFGPSCDDTGYPIITIDVLSYKGVGAAPYKYFRVVVRMSYSGTMVHKTPAAQPYAGPVTIGNITGVPFPSGWFIPNIEFKEESQVYEGANLNRFYSMGENSDRYDTGARFEMNDYKAAQVVKELVQVQRNSPFSFVVPVGCYPFGVEKGNGPFQVKLIQNKIELVNEKYNHWVFNLKFNYISG